MRKLVLTLLAATGLLSACNTIAGVGQDISAVGRGLTSSSDDVQHGRYRDQQNYNQQQYYNQQNYNRGQGQLYQNPR